MRMQHVQVVNKNDRMPIQREHFQFFLIFLCVPIQYWIVNQSGSTESARSYQLSLIIQELKDFHTKYFKIESWVKWLKELQLEQRPDPGTGESIAKEVFEYREKIDQGHFASSTKIRDVRKPEVRKFLEIKNKELLQFDNFFFCANFQVKFRVGQVIKHKKWGYRGVVVGWDEFTQAPESWIKQMHGPDRPEWRKQPNYSVLVDTRDRQGAQITYVVQENMEVVKNVKVFHPQLDEHFESYDGSHYLPRPWLKARYPLD